MTEFSAPALIRLKRQGHCLQAAHWQAVANGIGSDTWSEGQIGAFAMAVAWRGLSRDECRDFTLALRDSGRCMDWRELPGPTVDKHSTGGVGDCVSLLLAPLLAACGAFVPMVSGRGLGHTGGTLDKLESLPGYQVLPTLEHFRAVVRDVGCAIVGAGPELAPADRRLYAVRDVTATVDVPDLVVASILSKKLAAGAHALLLDIKTGSGALIPDLADATALGERLLQVATRSGLPTRAMLSDMGQVLGSAAGNALEIATVLDLLCDRGGCPRLRALVMAQASALLQMSGLAGDADDAERMLQKAWSSGAAAERFARMVAALGGPKDLLDRADDRLPKAPVQRPVVASRSGFVAAIDVRALGEAVVALGGGRLQPGQVIDPAVGLDRVQGRGVAVHAGELLAMVHARTPAAAEAAAKDVAAAFDIADEAPSLPVLYQWFDSQEGVS